jgi:biopolymer transport protein ExbD
MADSRDRFPSSKWFTFIVAVTALACYGVYAISHPRNDRQKQSDVQSEDGGFSKRFVVVVIDSDGCYLGKDRLDPAVAAKVLTEFARANHANTVVLTPTDYSNYGKFASLAGAVDRRVIRYVLLGPQLKGGRVEIDPISENSHFYGL